MSRARKVVEIAFGILANRWRLFHRRIQLNPDNVTTVVKATVLLHNILTVPADKVCSEVIDRGTILDDDAFQVDLPQLPMMSETTLQIISTVWQVLLNGKMSMPMYIRYTVY